MQSHAVGQVVDLDPAVGPGLAAEELASHPLGKDLRPAAGHGADAGSHHALQDLRVRELESLVEVIDLGRRERLDLDGGSLVLDGAQQVLVPLERDVGMVAADDMHLVHVGRNLAQDFGDRVLVGVVVAALGGEVAELARQHTDICRIDVDVEREVHAVVGASAGGPIGHSSQADDIRRLETAEPVSRAEAASFPDAFPDGLQRGVAEAHVGSGDRLRHGPESGPPGAG